MKRRILRIPDFFLVAYMVVVLTFFVVISSAKTSNYGLPTSKVKRHTTIVSGYGSQRHPLAGRIPTHLSQFGRIARSVDTKKLSNSKKLLSLSEQFRNIAGNVDDDVPLFIQPTFSTNADERSAVCAFKIFCAKQNETLSISVASPPVFDETVAKFPLQLEEIPLNFCDMHESEWIPVEGIFGLYTLPSGFVLVWIVQSEPIYKAPPVAVPISKTNVTRQNWWDIYRVSELHLTHVAFSCNGTVYRQLQQPTFSRMHRLEEKRQLSLLRQALKDHEWYYCKSDRRIVPDMTRNLQNCILSMFPFAAPLNDTILNSSDSVEGSRFFENVGDSSSRKDSPRINRWWDYFIFNESNRPDSHFFWNEVALTPFLNTLTCDDIKMAHAAKMLLEYCIPITSAFCGVIPNISTSNDRDDDSVSLRYDQLLISRRSRFRAGTRFTRRGADSTGAVANFVETEQILFLWKYEPTYNESTKSLFSVMSYVQTRGSIPLRWSSPTDIKTYRPRVRIGTDPLAQARALQQHLVDQGTKYLFFPSDLEKRGLYQGNRSRYRSYPSLLLVNLVDKKSDQGRLGRALDAVLKAVLDVSSVDPNNSFPWLNKSSINHVWFDFHAEVKAGRWDRLVGLVDEVKLSLLGHNYFAASPRSWERTDDGILPHMPFHIDHLQTGIIRTNCMDCLDRTNVVQSMFGRYLLFQQLADVKSCNLPLAYKTAFRKSPLSLPWTNGEISHRHLWADNADAISRLYAGTPALKGDFTRTGKRTKKGALDDGVNSLQRYYLNNFLDSDRQEGIDLLTGSELFSNVNERSESCKSVSFGNKISSKLSLREAARQVSLGTVNVNEPTDLDRDFVRIKYKKHGRFHKSHKRDSDQRHLDLRWLPGDIQIQFRNLIQHSNGLNGDQFKPSELIQAIDDRVASDLPWWVTSDSSDVD